VANGRLAAEQGDEADEAFGGTNVRTASVTCTEVPPHARAGQVGRGHRFAAYPRCSADPWTREVPRVTNDGTFDVVGGRAFCRPTGSVSVDEAISMVGVAIGECRARRVAQLVANISGLTGYVLTMSDRLLAVESWAEAAGGRVKLALVMQEAAIHSSRFGVLVARRRGMTAEVFTTEADAVAWLDLL
jgi:hypothetical protein